jgi:16S rRNA G1207 methylase RsmC
VFSSSGIDKGTAILLSYLHSERGAHVYGKFTADGVDTDSSESAPDEPINVLDLGCGWGVITLDAMLSLVGVAAKISAVDVNQHAVQLSNLNVAEVQKQAGVANQPGFPDAKAYLPQELPTLEYDLVLSNPPIRIGKTATIDLLVEYLDRLKSSGMAVFVIQKNLGADSIAKVLSERGFVVEKRASSKGFRILEVKKVGDAT